MTENNSPRVRVSAVSINDGKVLLLKHRRAIGEFWVLPGGGVDFGESLTEALTREIREELSAEVCIGKPVAVGELIYPGRHVVEVFFSAQLEMKEKYDIKTDEGIIDAAWIEIEKLKSLRYLPIEMIPVIESLSSTDFPGCVYLGYFKGP